MKFYIKTIMTCILLSFSLSCERERRDKCEWYLIPDIDRKELTTDSMMPVCARNFISNKQDCRLMATKHFARNAYTKKFRYTDMKVDSIGIPRNIVDIQFCQ